MSNDYEMRVSGPHHPKTGRIRYPQWSEGLVAELMNNGYIVKESGPYNARTGRGLYSHNCELQRNHVRVRVNVGGVIILRDPGATIQISRPAGNGMTEVISPNAKRIDYRSHDRTEMLSCIRNSIVNFESRKPFTVVEAREYFFGESFDDEYWGIEKDPAEVVMYGSDD